MPAPIAPGGQVSLTRRRRSSHGGCCTDPLDGYTAKVMSDTGEGRPPGSHETTLYFFPEGDVTEEELREILASDDLERRAWAISHMLRYGLWDDIWTYVDRDEVREIFPALDLPENLRLAWGRMLKIEAPVT